MRIRSAVLAALVAALPGSGQSADLSARLDVSRLELSGCIAEAEVRNLGEGFGRVNRVIFRARAADGRVLAEPTLPGWTVPAGGRRFSSFEFDPPTCARMHRLDVEVRAEAGPLLVVQKSLR